MTTNEQANPSQPEQPSPGKTRTYWHPLLVQLLTQLLSGLYQVIGELSVGKVPLRVDVFLLRQQDATDSLPDEILHESPALLSRLNRFTLIEYKGPTDVLEQGDVSHLFGTAMLWYSQQEDQPDHGQVTLIVMATTLPRAVRDELQRLGSELTEVERGVHQVRGFFFDTWILETDELADRDALLAMFSQVFLNQTERIIDLISDNHRPLLDFMLQQVEQFKTLSPEVLMQFKDTELANESFDDFVAAWVQRCPTEYRLRGLPPEERLRGLPPEERLRGLSPQDLADALSPEERDRLRQLLNEFPSKDD